MEGNGESVKSRKTIGPCPELLDDLTYKRTLFLHHEHFRLPLEAEFGCAEVNNLISMTFILHVSTFGLPTGAIAVRSFKAIR